MDNKYKVKLSMKAKEDFKGIVLYIKNQLKEPVIAKNYATIIKEEINKLDYYPEKFAIIDDDLIKDLGIRKLNIKHYIAFYRVIEEDKVVSIERILYGNSDWINKL